MSSGNPDSWKVIDGGFAYNEGSLNFTLRGGAFHDDDGDGIPDGVSFENGRPVFMNIKNLRDFHFDVPRGYIIVNGNEYKLVDLDGNNDNGEELQLFKANVGFPEGEDRTNPAAYQKTGENQFTYNEGSLHYTLTGGAFHDDDGDGVPDGVKIIGPKPSFGADGTVFDTSVENFHFKVPSGALMVNGEMYKLAELDNNPDNGYELVIPEVEGGLGWTKIDGGFSYKRPADNNPANMGGLKLFGAGLVDKNGDGEPDGVKVSTIRIGEEIDGVRVTKIGIEGLSGEVFLNHPQYSLGVIGDNNYGVTIIKHGGDLAETVFTNISPGATVKVTTGTERIETDGNGIINVVAEKPFRINNSRVSVNGSALLKLNVRNGKIVSYESERLGWQKIGTSFEFTGVAVNDPTQIVRFSISGRNIVDKDGDGAPDNITVPVLRKVRGLGVRVGIDGLSGNVFLNGKSLGIKNDNNYTVHFTPIVDPNISPENLAQVQSLELLNISSGAIINSPGNWIILEGDGVYHFGKGDYFIATKPAHSIAELQSISVSGNGAEVTIKNDTLLPADNLSIVSGVSFNGSDEVEKPAPQIHKDNITEEKMYGAPLRVHSGGGEGDGGDSGGDAGGDSGGAEVAADSVELDAENFDYQISEEITDEELVDLAQNVDEENSGEAKIALIKKIQALRDAETETDLENQPVEVSPNDIQIDLNLPEFQRINLLAEQFQKISAATAPEENYDADLFSIDAILDVKNFALREENSNAEQNSALKPNVQIVQAERESKFTADNFFQPVDKF